MFTRSIHKNVYKTIINLINNEKSDLKFLSDLNDMDDDEKKDISDSTGIELPCDLGKAASAKVLEGIRFIINGAGQEPSARFTLLLSNPGEAYEDGYEFIGGEYFDVGTIYLMACMALSGKRAKMDDAIDLVEYLKATLVEIHTGINARPLQKKKSLKWWRILACIFMVSTIALGCASYYFYQNALQSDLDYKAARAKSDINFTRFDRSNSSLEQYYLDFAYITKSGTKYHKDGCPYIEDRDLFVDCIVDLKKQGYKQCSYCYSDDFRIWERE